MKRLGRQVIVLLIIAMLALPGGQVQGRSGRSMGDREEIPEASIYLPMVRNGNPGPRLLSPSSGAHLDTLCPLFHWDTGPTLPGTRVHLEVSLDAHFSTTVLRLETNSASGPQESRFPWNLAPATQYYWRIYLSSNGQPGLSSDVRAFTTGSGGTLLPAPSLVAPGSGSLTSGLEVTFYWSPVAGALEYHINFLDHASQVRYGGLWTTQTQMTLNFFSPNRTYDWWVEARNGYGMGAPSQRWSFTTPAVRLGQTPHGAGWMGLTRPAGGEILQIHQTLE